MFDEVDKVDEVVGVWCSLVWKGQNPVQSVSQGVTEVGIHRAARAAKNRTKMKKWNIPWNCKITTPANTTENETANIYICEGLSTKVVMYKHKQWSLELLDFRMNANQG